MDLLSIWQRISRWHAAHVPANLFRPAKGASSQDIANLEATLGLRLPDDVRESWSIHNGLNGGFLLHHGELLSLDGIAHHWQDYRQRYGDVFDDYEPVELQGPAKKVWWNRKRVHVTENNGDHITLDLDPPSDGNYGQLLEHSHEVGPMGILAPSWGSFLERIASDLEAGEYVYDTREQVVAPPGMFS